MFRYLFIIAFTFCPSRGESETMDQCTRDEAFVFDSSNDLLDIIHGQIAPDDQYKQGQTVYDNLKGTIDEIFDSGLMFNVPKDQISQRIDDLFTEGKITEETKESTMSMITNASVGSGHPPSSATDHEFFLVMPLGPATENLTFAYCILKFVPKLGQKLQLNESDSEKLEYYIKTKAISNFEEKNSQVISQIKEGKQRCSATLQAFYGQMNLQAPKTSTESEMLNFQ